MQGARQDVVERVSAEMIIYLLAVAKAIRLVVAGCRLQPLTCRHRRQTLVVHQIAWGYLRCVLLAASLLTLFTAGVGVRQRRRTPSHGAVPLAVQSETPPESGGSTNTYLMYRAGGA